MARKLSKRLNTEIKRLQARLVEQGLNPEHLPADAHFQIAAQAGAELVEDISQRARNRKIFRHMPGGPTTILTTIGSMHYQDAEDQWQEIDTQLVPGEEPGWDWEMSKSHWRLLVKEDGWVAAEKQGVGIGWKLTNWGYLNKVTKEYVVKGTADYSLPVVDGSGISWEIFPNVTLKLWATPDQLREDIEVPQAVRDYIAANNPYGNDGMVVYVYEVRWDDVPEIEDEEQGQQSPDVNWEGDGRIFLKNLAGQIISTLPSHFVKHEDPLAEPVRIRRRFIKEAGKYYLLFGVSVQSLAAMPEGTVVFDPTVNEQVGAGADDGYCTETDSAWDTGKDYVLFGDRGGVSGPGHAFLRFTTVAVPQGATIDSATLTATAFSASSLPAVVDVHADDTDNAVAPTSCAEMAALSRTTAKVDWSIAAWVTDTEYSPADIKALIQEVVNRGGWVSDNDLQIIIDDDGSTIDHYVIAYSQDEGSGKAAKLSITYTPVPIPRNPAIMFQCPAIV